MSGTSFLDYEGLEYYHKKIKDLIASFSSGLPLNTIVIWSGSEDNIPEGWHLCNGEDGTPDLRGKFVLGSSKDHPINSEGGSETASIKVDSDEGGSLFSAGDEDIASEIDIMPPYYTLCYIMKVSEGGAGGSSSGTGVVYTAGDGITIEGTTISVTHPVKPVTASEYQQLSEEEKMSDAIYGIFDDKKTTSSSQSKLQPSASEKQYPSVEYPSIDSTATSGSVFESSDVEYPVFDSTATSGSII